MWWSCRRPYIAQRSDAILLICASSTLSISRCRSRLFRHRHRWRRLRLRWTCASRASLLKAKRASRCCDAFALRVERDRERAVVEIGPLPPAATAAAATLALGGYLIDARPLKDLKGRLVLSFSSTADDYAGRVEIRGSDDLVFWRPLASGPLTRSRSLGEVIERNHFVINRPPAFMRVAWTSKDAPDIERAQFLEDVAASVTLPRAQLDATLSDDRRSLYRRCA